MNESYRVPRVPISEMDAETFYRRYQQPGSPVILTGILDGVSPWSLSFLEKNLGDQAFPVRWYGNARNGQDKREWTTIGSGVEVRSTPFKDYADLLRSGEANEHDIYLAKATLAQAALRQHAPIPQLEDKLLQLGFRPQRSNDFNLWVGPVSHVESLHYDMLDGTLIQLYGSKRLVLFPPQQTGNLYPFPTYVHLYRGLNLRSWFSQVYPDQPDLRAFPRLAQALQYKTEVILGPGELIFLPSGWWHEVSAMSGDDMVCSVNRFWSIHPRRRALLSPSVWRVYTGFTFSLPYIGTQALSALVSENPKERLRKIRYQI